MRPLYRLSLGQQLAGLEGVAAPGHRRQPEVSDHRVQPPQRPARGLRPVAAQLRVRGAPDVIVGHIWQHGGGRPTQYGESLPDELGPCHPGKAALDKRAVSPHRVQRPGVGQPARIDVHTPHVESLSGATVQLAVQAGQDLLPCPADRAAGQGHQVDITDTRDVIPGGQGPGHQQIGHPSKAVQTLRKMTNDRRHVGHAASLRPRISAQIQLSRIENVQVTVSSQPSTKNREPTQVCCSNQMREKL